MRWNAKKRKMQRKIKKQAKERERKGERHRKRDRETERERERESDKGRWFKQETDSKLGPAVAAIAMTMGRACYVTLSGAITIIVVSLHLDNTGFVF